MASTKKTTKKATVDPSLGRVKMIDTMSENVAPAIRKLYASVDKDFKQQIKDSDIPVLRVLSKTLDAQTYFLNHLDLEAIMGKHVDLLDRMMVNSICKYIVESIQYNLEHSQMKYPGIWDNYTLYNISAAAVTLMKNDFNDELYLTGLQFACISKEDLEGLNPASYMPFSEFNMNRFGEQVISLQHIVVNVISGMIDSKIPKAFLSSSDRPIGTRLYELYYQYLHDDMETFVKELGEAGLEVASSERKISHFIDVFEKPFLTMMSNLMDETGTSTNLINMMLGSSKINIIYDDPKNGAAEDDVPLSKINLNYVMTSKGLNNSEKNAQITFRINIRDAIEMAITPEDEIAKTRKENFGKGIRTFLIDMITYCLNIYFMTVAASKEPDTAYINDAAPVQKPAERTGKIEVVDGTKTAAVNDADEVKDITMDDLLNTMH